MCDARYVRSQPSFSRRPVCTRTAIYLCTYCRELTVFPVLTNARVLIDNAANHNDDDNDLNFVQLKRFAEAASTGLVMSHYLTSVHACVRRAGTSGGAVDDLFSSRLRGLNGRLKVL